jgi:hypothetical protein
MLTTTPETRYAQHWTARGTHHLKGVPGEWAVVAVED